MTTRTIITGVIVCTLIGVIGCEMFDRDEASHLTAPAGGAELSSFIMGHPEISEWGAQYEPGRSYAMVDIPVAGALQVSYGIVGGGTFALFLETTQPVKLEIGLLTRDGVTDALDWVCVTYETGATFAQKPAAAVAASAGNGAWTHYQRDENGALSPWWPPDAGFVFSGATQTQCVIQQRAVIVAEVSGPFPKATPTPQPTQAASAAPPVTVVVMYNAGQHTGALSGRAGADALCAAAKPAGLHAGYINFKAFISINTGDAIADIPFPATLPIQGPTGTLIDNNRTDLLDGSDILVALDTAGVLPFPGGYFWSGSDANGNYDAQGGAINNCQNFTSAAAGDGGALGNSPHQMLANWVLSTGWSPCDSSLPLLCIAY